MSRRDEWGPAGLELSDLSQPAALSRGMVDRSAEHRGDAAWVARQWADRGQVLRLAPDGTTAVDRGLALALVPAADLGPAPPEGTILLGVDDTAAYFCLLDGEPSAPGPLARARGLREVGAELDDRDAGLFATATAMGGWHRTNGHCPRCGAATLVESAGWVRRCPVDGSSQWPRTDPAVIVLITDPAGDHALLGRQPSWPPGRYSCLAGFVEPGESAEQAVVREVLEEAGVAVTDVRSVSSQPWPFPQSLMLGFTAVADPATAAVRTDDELEDVRWWSRGEVLGGAIVPPPTISIANRLISAWLAAP